LANVRESNPSAQMRAEKQHLLALVKMQRGEFRQAASTLQKNWGRAPGNWELYARFNLAAALIQSGRLQAGMELLKQTSFKTAHDDEAQALIDKVNQAMGYLLLQQQQPEEARVYLEKVRLHGPYSNMALLGAGWAGAMLKQYKRALVPWLELHGRDVRETSVLEVMLSVPYAYEQLHAWGQAAAFYQKAIAVFQQELAMLGQTITDIEDDRMGEVLRNIEVIREQAWMENMQVIEERSATRYIKQLMDDESFFNIMTNYREARAILAHVREKTARLNELQIHPSLQGEQRAQVETYAVNLNARAEQLVKNVQKEIVIQEDKLKLRALQLLEQKKAKLDVNLVQARLALAQSYERLEASTP
jgi:tetratricopeptide (TPR) repeat protein